MAGVSTLGQTDLDLLSVTSSLHTSHSESLRPPPGLYTMCISHLHNPTQLLSKHVLLHTCLILVLGPYKKGKFSSTIAVSQ